MYNYLINVDRKEKMKECYSNNKDKMKEWFKIYYQNNKEKILKKVETITGITKKNKIILNIILKLFQNVNEIIIRNTSCLMMLIHIKKQTKQIR